MSLNLDNVKLLMVGAGGIGCELLKNLVLTGFTNIEVIDLDTIELSNLNRQFLFQKVHVGKPKAIIARESVLKYNPNANIIACHDNIMNVKYNVEYYKQFNLVLNALDNKAARSHVNRLCLAADVPLIESGSAGYLGQVTLIKKGLTECYDCLPKPPAKTFAGCTIRNTPSEPIHCIVWAKHLFNQLFGVEDPDEAVSPDGEDPENMADAGKATVEKSSNEEAVVRVSTRQWAKETKYDPIKVFNKLFNDDVKYLLSMSKLWEKRKAPKPLDWNESINDHTIPVVTEKNGTTASTEAQHNNSNKEDEANKIAALKIWTVSECCEVFCNAVKALHKRLEESEESENQVLYWDKDDEDAMNFVASAANLRCFIFSINIKSKFEIKSLAGNIIPAIATTNAIVAGLIVLQALKVLKQKIDSCKMVFIRDRPTLNKIIVSSQLVKPNPKCYVCASKPEICVKLNVNTFTVKQFETKILKQELNMVQPDVEIDDGTGRIIISSEEGETEENNDKPLSFFGLTDQSSLKCDDFFQNYELKVTIFQCEQFDAQNTKEYEIVSDNQMFKDLQAQIQKDNEQKTSVEQKSKETTSSEDKKRRYQTAFEEDEGTTSSSNSIELINTKKLKSSDNSETDQIELNKYNNATDENKAEEMVEQDDVLCTSNSINDASDAISDEEENCVESKLQNNSETNSNSYEQTSRRPQMNVIDEEILVDDDIIIEENSNDLRLENGDENYENSNSNINTNLNSNSNFNSVSNNYQNENTNEADDDVIECSSDEDIIEINDDDEEANSNNANKNQSSESSDQINDYSNSSNNNLNGNGNGHGNHHYENGSSNTEENTNGNKISNIKAHLNSSNHHSNGHENGKKQANDESDDNTITLVE